jgi:hypothetical protein
MRCVADPPPARGRCERLRGHVFVDDDGTAAQVTVTFDDKYRIRVLDVEKYAHTEELSEASGTFVQSTRGPRRHSLKERTARRDVPVPPPRREPGV